MQSQKSTSATRFCKVCFKKKTANDTASLFQDYSICPACFHKMRPKIIVSNIDGLKVTSLFIYNETIKTMLYQLKGCFDYEMADVFLSRQKSYFKWKYKNWILVPAPSYSKRNEARGFNHVEEIFKCLGNTMIKPIVKINNVKQADLNYEERQTIGKHLSWDKKVSVKGQNILFVDDLFTTGATARACSKMLLEHGAKRVEVLVMARTANPNERKGIVGVFYEKLRQIVCIFKKKEDE